jgi:ribonuclease HI
MQAALDLAGDHCRLPGIGLTCFIDGSFSPPAEGGAAYILFRDKCLVQYEALYFQSQSPLHSELQALCLAIEAIRNQGTPDTIIATDCLVLVRAMASSMPPLDLDWRLYK